ncbi:MAG TPA: MFS transporter [Solirubrobacteraceae bacterium]
MSTTAGTSRWKPGTDPEKTRKAVRGGFFGFFVDMYDIYLPVVVLVPALAYFVSPKMSDSGKSLAAGAIFAATLVGRPVGALIFGHFADRIGRRRTAIVATAGFATGTVLIGLMPGYTTLGATSVVLFVALRFIVGCFVGGGYTSANPLVMEYSRKDKRWLNSAIVMVGYPVAYVVIALLTLAVLQIAPSGAADSAYSTWGWRIPFFVGGALAFSFLAWFIRNVPESELFEETGGTEAPLKELVGRRENVMAFLQVFVLMSGFWLTLQTAAAVLPKVLKSTVGLGDTSATFTLVIAYIALIGGYFAAGWMSERMGRRPFLMAFGVSAATLGTLVYYVLLAQKPGLGGAILLCCAIAVLTSSEWSLATSYITERFHTSVRASGFAAGYSLAVIAPSFYAFYMKLLGNVMSPTYTVLPLLAFGGVLIVVGAALGPETRDVDFEDDVAGEPAAEERPRTGRFVRDSERETVVTGAPHDR